MPAVLLAEFVQLASEFRQQRGEILRVFRAINVGGEFPGGAAAKAGCSRISPVDVYAIKYACRPAILCARRWRSTRNVCPDREVTFDEKINARFDKRFPILR